MTYQYQAGVLLGALIYIIGTTQIISYYRYQKAEANKEILSNKNQIDFLNKQLNPHFLFNTLNTIYGISLKYPQKTPELIIKVSELLRYQVDNTKKNFVSLENEIYFISSYIEFEKERLGYRCDIIFEYNIDNPKNYHIAPMLLFTFIENAFKHGTQNIEQCFVTINVSVLNSTLKLEISNSLPVKENPVPSTKVGLKNTIARLKILYPKKHFLDLHSVKNKFITTLEINL